MGNQPFYLKKKRKKKLHNASIIDKFGMYLPNHHELTETQIDFICNIVNSIIKD